MSKLEQWKLVEEAKWGPLPSLGPEWMGKSFTNERGYQVLLTNGCGIWGESRRAKYIIDKAEDWAPCLEAGVEEISSLVLSELTKQNVEALWTEEKQCVLLKVSSKLNNLSYRWEFELNRLTDELFKHHWVIPMFVQVCHLGLQVRQLTKEVEQKKTQLEELLPDTKLATKTSNKTSKSKNSLLESATERVCVSGPWAALQEHISLSPDIMKYVNTFQLQAPEDNPSKSKTGKAPAIPVLVDVETEAEIEAREAEEQKKRRAKIQEITQGTSVQSIQGKKKKKLKI
ncbi:hypothetical protein Pcinc_018498 [Petrolisthes cinctipes]|uniref:XLF-like N-terminal domain-containing protein n=1 Tax=Petrolisthes cinctipes TaxID=88211 RepID=A0AAE1FNK4_PETCI|nr:hypothetical protein Pcinc_018498 [Petrolisthes cinctipes]